MKVIDNLIELTSPRLTTTEVQSPEDFVSLKSAIVQVADAGTRSVSVVREAFGAGVAPFTTVGSGSVSNYLQTFVQGDLAKKIVQDTSRLGLMTAPAGGSTPLPKVELDSVEVVEDVNRGVIDQFTVHLSLSLPITDLPRVNKLRVFRAYVRKASLPRPGFAALMDAPRVSSKGVDPLFPNALKADQLGIGNVVTSFVSQNPGSPSLSVISPAEKQLSDSLLPLNTNKTTAMTSAGLVSFAADRSVVENLSVYLNRRAVGALDSPTRPPLTPGKTSGINVMKGAQVAAVGEIVQTGNGLGFTAIGDVTPFGPSVRTIGDITEITFIDATVVYGGVYSFFVAAVGQHGEIGPRSRIVEVTVARTVPPEQPKVTYGLSGGVPRFSLRCSKGTSHIEVYRSGRAAINSTVIGSTDSLIIQGPANKVGEFYHAGDLGLGPDGSTTFVDRDIVPGDKPTYRFYAVDPYGLKSQTPFSCSLMIPSNGEPLPLAIPSLTTEQLTSGKNAVRVSVTCDDPRITAFLFTRRDITVNERAVHQANQPEYVTIGTLDAKRAGSRSGPTLKDTQWASVMPSTSGSASFVDTTVRIDRVYQYAVQAVDRRGNKTFNVGAQPVGVYSKPTISAPTDLTAKVVFDGPDPKGVLLTWTPGTVDFSPNQLLDDQDVLAATSVRSVFQVERRLKGAPFWDSMPATSESYFIDPSGDAKPTSRPPYVVNGNEYEYRVLTMQSGGFLSPHTDAISVSVVPPPRQPDIVWVRTTGLTVRPLNAVVSWNAETAFVHHWEVQRAVTNKSYGSRITSMDSQMARDLPYETVASITPEASRASGLKADKQMMLDKTVYVGNRFFIDSNIDPANSYFYRVRSIGSFGIASDWSYGGMSITDYAYDRKYLSTLSDDEKVSLVSDPRPVVTRLNPITTMTTSKLRPKT